MWMRNLAMALTFVSATALYGCTSRPQFQAKPEPWRADEEANCLESGHVRESRFVVGRSALGGPSACGAARPFAMLAAANGQVALKPVATLRCPMIPAVDRWVQAVVLPAAKRHLRATVVELKVAASYSCRPRNGIWGAKLSEHGHANALDISSFVLSDGRIVTLKGGWRGDPAERAFLREVHAGACTIFYTVLGPDADRFHFDHFHLDLARHGRDGNMRICR